MRRRGSTGIECARNGSAGIKYTGGSAEGLSAGSLSSAGVLSAGIVCAGRARDEAVLQKDPLLCAQVSGAKMCVCVCACGVTPIWCKGCYDHAGLEMCVGCEFLAAGWGRLWWPCTVSTTQPASKAQPGKACWAMLFGCESCCAWCACHRRRRCRSRRRSKCRVAVNCLHVHAAAAPQIQRGGCGREHGPHRGGRLLADAGGGGRHQGKGAGAAHQGNGAGAAHQGEGAGAAHHRRVLVLSIKVGCWCCASKESAPDDSERTHTCGLLHR